jgi:hypothetical protein
MKINIIGLGGVGLKILRELVESNFAITSMKLWDGDVIEARNLERQIYRTDHIGMSKSEASKDMYCKENVVGFPCETFGDINLITLRENQKNICNDDVTFIATDNNESRVLLLNNWKIMSKNHVLISSANATADEGIGIGSTAWIYMKEWYNDPIKDPIIRNNLESNNHVNIGRPCSETSEPQTALANSGASIRAVELLSLWKHASSTSIADHLPIEHSLFYKQTTI